MKRSVRHIFALGVTVALVLLIAVHVTCAYLFSVIRYQYSLDAQFSGKISQDIVAFIEQNFPPQRRNAKDIFVVVHRQFPVVQSVVAQHVASGDLHLVVTAHKPLLSINQTHVLTHAGTIIAKEQFVEKATQQLADVQLSNVPTDVQVASRALQQAAPVIADSVNKNYHVCWVSDFETRLQDKEQPAFSVVCNGTTMCNQSLLERCQKLKAELLAQGEFEPKKKKKWVADIRFNKQIIVSWYKGEKDGKAVCR